MLMGIAASSVRVFLLFGALANFAGHVRGEDVLTNTAELNRCLTAVRVALTRRGVANVSPHTAAARPDLRTRPSQQV